jgi:hypothetical protein
MAQGYWDNFKPRVKVVITGENVNLAGELESLASFISLEQDPIRRTALIEKAMARKGYDISDLPRSEMPTQSRGGGRPVNLTAGSPGPSPLESNLGAQAL